MQDIHVAVLAGEIGGCRCNSRDLIWHPQHPTMGNCQIKSLLYQVIFMATVVSHLAVPLALTMAIGSSLLPHQLTMLAVICSVLPDLDALGLWVGPYAPPLGHRGITHSLPFSAAVARLR